MPSQRQTVQMPSQSQMSRGKDGLASQEHSVEMASQRSQDDMEIEYTATLPLEGPLNNMDGIEFGQWSVKDAWREPEIDHNNIIQDQTAENKVRLREAVFNKNCYYDKEAASKFPGAPPAGLSVETTSRFRVWQNKSAIDQVSQFEARVHIEWGTLSIQAR